jgi:hypothetical protein
MKFLDILYLLVLWTETTGISVKVMLHLKLTMARSSGIDIAFTDYFPD